MFCLPYFFFFLFNDFEQIELRIYWTNFHQITDLTRFPDGSWVVAMATNFSVKIGEIGPFT